MIMENPNEYKFMILTKVKLVKGLISNRKNTTDYINVIHIFNFS
jgi:hypothetical protein